MVRVNSCTPANGSQAPAIRHKHRSFLHRTSSMTVRLFAFRIAQLDKHLRGNRWRPLIRAIYNVMAPFYDWGARLLLPDYRLAGETLLAQLRVSSEDRLLDLGCGTGMLTVPAVSLAQMVVGLDMTPGMLAQLQGKIPRNHLQHVALVQADARRLPVRSQSFSVVVSSFMLLHLTTAEKRQVFADIHRSLVSSGRVGFLTSKHSLGDAYPTRRDWRTWLSEHGFVNVVISDYGEHFRTVTAHKP